MHPAAQPAESLLKECDETRTRRSGPGGQHRNKVETAVVLLHRPTGITAEASERRSQADNRRVALGRLRLKLALDHRMPPDPGGPSALWRRRTTGGRIVVAVDHDDYPALVAEALDRLQATTWDLPPAAATLGVTPSQLARLFRREPAAWTALARHRAQAGLPRLA
ncbi:MAG: peptide chain release factor family protein [Planctomycetota bacterium]